MCTKPKTVAELFRFYYKAVKPVYAHVESLNQPPIEMLFEINAAFDHLSRHWQYGDSEEEAVSKAAAHLKRCTFDAFKIILRETRDQFEELGRVDVAIINNGDFKQGMIECWGKIRELSTEARSKEGDSRDEHRWDEPFELWRKVYTLCVEFEQDFYRNPAVQWAKTTQRKRAWKSRLIDGIVAGVIGAILGVLLGQLFR